MPRNRWDEAVKALGIAEAFLKEAKASHVDGYHERAYIYWRNCMDRCNALHPPPAYEPIGSRLELDDDEPLELVLTYPY